MGQCTFTRGADGRPVCGDCGEVFSLPARLADYPLDKLFRSCAAKPAPARCGPGAQLRALLRSLRLFEQNGCRCGELAAKMDAWGLDGCRLPQHRAEILAQLNEEAKKVPLRERAKAFARAAIRGVFISPLDPAGSLLDEALRRMS